MSAPPLDPSRPVFIAGAGTMGAGIAQVAAQAGHPVKLFDVSRPALDQALRRLAASLEKRIANDERAAERARAVLARIEPAQTLDAAADAGLVVEAVVESLPVKHGLFQQLEAIVSDDCVIASNTSSLSITAIARGLRRPERCAGLHFFNPVPQMRLVEVVTGLCTAPGIADGLAALAERWGKLPVHARSTPGFIVNRIARPFYAEALALLQERAGAPALIDQCVRGAGFRMGPCELMDLIGHDVNCAVTEALFLASYGDKRFVPSALQRELVEAGWLGRKSGRGFFEYRDGAAGAPRPAPPAADVGVPSARQVVLHGSGELVERLAGALARAGRPFDRRSGDAWAGLETDGAQLRLTDGRPAGLVALRESVAELALVDLPLRGAAAAAQPSGLAWTAAATASPDWQRLVPQWLAAAGWAPCRVDDVAGLVVARTLAMLINEAADAVLQGVCSESTADRAMQLGANYPAGPFEWLSAWHVCDVVQLLDHLHEQYRGERYRVSPELRRRAWCCESRRHRSGASLAPQPTGEAVP